MLIQTTKERCCALPGKMPTASSAWVVFGATYFAYCVIYITRKCFSVVKTQIQGDLNLSTYTLGTIDSVFLTTYAAFQIFLPSLSDRFGARKTLVTAFTVAAFGAFGFSVSSSSRALITFWLLEGVAHAPIFSVCIRTVSLWIAPSKRGYLLGIWTTSQQLGGILATSLTTSIGATYGWRVVFVVAGGITAFTAAILGVFLPDEFAYPSSDLLEQRCAVVTGDEHHGELTKAYSLESGRKNLWASRNPNNFGEPLGQCSGSGTMSTVEMQAFPVSRRYSDDTSFASVNRQSSHPLKERAVFSHSVQNGAHHVATRIGKGIGDALKLQPVSENPTFATERVSKRAYPKEINSSSAVLIKDEIFPTVKHSRNSTTDFGEDLSHSVVVGTTPGSEPFSQRLEIDKSSCSVVECFSSGITFPARETPSCPSTSASAMWLTRNRSESQTSLHALQEDVSSQIACGVFTSSHVTGGVQPEGVESKGQLWNIPCNKTRSVGIKAPSVEKRCFLAGSSPRKKEGTLFGFSPLPKTHQVEAAVPLSFLQVLCLPGLLLCATAYFCVKLVRYALLFWLPYFLVKQMGFSATRAGYSSMLLDVGGVIGAVLSGAVVAKCFKGLRFKAANLFCIITGLSLVVLAYLTWSCNSCHPVLDSKAIALRISLLSVTEVFANLAAFSDPATVTASSTPLSLMLTVRPIENSAQNSKRLLSRADVKFVRRQLVTSMQSMHNAPTAHSMDKMRQPTGIRESTEFLTDMADPIISPAFADSLVSNFTEVQKKLLVGVTPFPSSIISRAATPPVASTFPGFKTLVEGENVEDLGRSPYITRLLKQRRAMNGGPSAKDTFINTSVVTDSLVTGLDTSSGGLRDTRISTLITSDETLSKKRTPSTPPSNALLPILIIIGFLIAMPDSILGATSAGYICESVGAEGALSTATGIVNGLGAFGGATQGYITTLVSENFGWPFFFLVLCVVCWLGATVLIPQARIERQTCSTFSPRGLTTSHRSSYVGLQTTAESGSQNNGKET